MRATLERYLKLVGEHDVEGVVALFAEDVSVEDPVGGSPGTHVVGRDDVAAFFREGFARSRPRPRRRGEIVTTGDGQAAMAFTLELELRGEAREVEVIDFIRFDPSGKIIELRAFWNEEEIRPRA